jgi:hypothetical protein
MNNCKSYEISNRKSNKSDKKLSKNQPLRLSSSSCSSWLSTAVWGASLWTYTVEWPSTGSPLRMPWKLWPSTPAGGVLHFRRPRQLRSTGSPSGTLQAAQPSPLSRCRTSMWRDTIHECILCFVLHCRMEVFFGIFIRYYSKK